MPRLATAARLGAVLLAVVMAESCSDDATRPTRPSPLADPQVMAVGGALTVNLDQCANDPRTANCSWQNGDLNGNNSIYAEGLAIPFRLEIDNIKAGKHSFHVNYDFTAGGHEGYDFLADYDATEKVDLCAAGGGGRSSLCDVLDSLTKTNATSVMTWPSDGTAIAGANNLLVSGAETSAIFGVNAKRHLYAWGATIDSITPADPTHAGPTTGNSTADFVVWFTNSSSTDVAFAWSGHLAQSSYWKNADASADGAGQISGAPWHMRTQQLDGAGNKNQDRSIQPSALVQEPVLSITKTPTSQTKSAGESFSWTVTLTNGGPGTATAAAIADTLPVVTGVSYALGAGSDASCTLNTSASPNVLACGPKDLAEGATIVAVINATTTANQGCVSGGFTNTATGKAGNAASVSATATTTLECPNLTISKTPDADTLTPPGTAAFTIVVKNTGAGKAFSVALTDTLLSTLTWSLGTYSGWTTCGITSGRLTCSLATLNAGDSAKVTVSAPVSTSFVFQPPTANGTALEIDGNLVPNGGTDWSNFPGINCTTRVGCHRDTTGSKDDSFGQGTKEDTPVPTITDGSIPNNKSDLLRFYIGNNRVQVTQDSVHDLLYLGWERVQAPSGTTNMDFELNQSKDTSANHVTPVRTEGDILIKYDLSKGGTVPTIGFQRWVVDSSLAASVVCEASNSYPCWSKGVTVTSAAAAINTDTTTDPIPPNAPRLLDALTFGEARIDLQRAGVFVAGQCVSFGQAYLKSRSSDSFTAEIKDFVAPVPISVTNCQPTPIPNKSWVTATNVTALSDTGLIVVRTP